ncbi:hypothetical protein BC629DRAFT_1525289 [Irpex lacteus]|nr:hypothetical protein BC629DRAFT_1558674 [Irpex lacteus]KAI0777097.1 hypothetical protein BC629DRAFT_1525289 [Irpex lacteus]
MSRGRCQIRRHVGRNDLIVMLSGYGGVINRRLLVNVLSTEAATLSRRLRRAGHPRGASRGGLRLQIPPDVQISR